MAYKINGIVSGKVVEIDKNWISVELKDGTKHKVHISNVSDFYVSSLNNLFKIGQKSKFIIISVDKENNIVKLDWKTIHPRFLKGPFEYEMKETKKGFSSLKENTEREVKNA